MRVLVTGGAGFIGCNLARVLESAGHRVAAVDDLSLGVESNLPASVQLIVGDVGDAAVWKRIPEIEAIVHLAGSSSTPMFETGLADAFRNNVTGFLRVLEQARLRGIKQLVYASTSLVYGNVDPPLRESGPTDDLNFYALSKHTMENIARLFYAERGMTSVGLRFMSVYGPRENHKGRMANLVSQFIWDIEAGRAPVIYGSGTQTRDFTSVWDVAAAIERFLARPGDGGARVFNVGAGVATSLNELVERLSAVMGVPVAPVYVPIPVGRAYNRSQVASIDAIRRENGWKPAVSLEAGVREILRLRGWPAGGHPAERAVA